MRRPSLRTRQRGFRVLGERRLSCPTRSISTPGEDGLIHYRVVDEYETDFACTPESTIEPLSLAEMIDLIDTVEDWGWGVYEKTADPQPLRKTLSAEGRRALIDRFYRPHQRRLSSAVDRALARCAMPDRRLPQLPVVALALRVRPGSGQAGHLHRNR